MTETEKTSFLTRLFDGDTHVGTDLRALVRRRRMPGPDAPPVAPRTVGDLRARAEMRAQARLDASAEKASADRKRREAEAERVRRNRLDAVARRGKSVWREIETEIDRRSAAAYDRAAGLLADLKAIAMEKGSHADFMLQLKGIRERHARKERLIERLVDLG